jgi:hypothetical protein
MNRIRNKLRELIELLRNGNEPYYAAKIEDALSGTEEDLKAYLISNELWGGAGSIADQALIETRESRRNIEKLLAELGEIQLKHGIVNVRTEMWTTTFREWQKQGI